MLSFLNGVAGMPVVIGLGSVIIGLWVFLWLLVYQVANYYGKIAADREWAKRKEDEKEKEEKKEIVETTGITRELELDFNQRINHVAKS